MIRLSVIGIGLLVTVAIDARAQALVPLFATVDATASDRTAAGVSTRRTKPVFDRRLVNMRLDQLLDPSVRRVLLNVGSHEWIAAFERLDTIQGAHAWTGTIEGIDNSHVSFVLHEGAVVGLINAVGEIYAVQTLSNGMYTLDRVIDANKEALPIVPEQVALGDAPEVSGTATDDGSLIDVLILYTPAARTAAAGGGTSSDPIKAKAAQVISDTNTAYANSGIVTRVRLAEASEIALNETSSMAHDLGALRSSGAAAAARNAVGADLVLLLQDALDPLVCGIGYQLNQSNAASFAQLAFAVADIYVGCVYTPTHELGHLQGVNHDKGNDGGLKGAYDYSYGLRDSRTPSPFRTIMAYDSASCCPRIPYFSNPLVANPANGRTTGGVEANNAATITNTAFIVSNFRQAPASGTSVPAAPTGLASSVNGVSVTISWNPVMADSAWAPSAATGYAIDVGTAPGVYNVYSQLNVGHTTSVSGAGPAATYYWRVRGYNAAGFGAASAEASFSLSTSCAAAGAPQDFTYTIGANRFVTLSWGPPPGGGGPFAYTIDVGFSSGQTLLSLPVGTGTTVSVQAPPGIYFVRVRASNTCTPSMERTIVVQ